MTIFVFDGSFEGLLTALFDAYAQRTFPHVLLKENEPLPLFYDKVYTVITDNTKSNRVWTGLEKRLSNTALICLAQTWLAEEEDTPIVMLRYMQKVIDAKHSIETNFADQDILALTRMWKRVDWERIRLMQFIRFQKADDGTYVAAIEPEKNALPLVIHHFQDRFAQQRWLIYDLRRQYGYYYDLHTLQQVTFDINDDVFSSPQQASFFQNGRLPEELMDTNEKLFQQLWKSYFKAIAIKERFNPVKLRKDMPVRYWKYLTEKQDPTP